MDGKPGGGRLIRSNLLIKRVDLEVDQIRGESLWGGFQTGRDPLSLDEQLGADLARSAEAYFPPSNEKLPRLLPEWSHVHLSANG